MKILIIEDESRLREALLQSLSNQGYLTDGTENGLDGVEMIRSGVYDLVLLDIMLPGIDGIEVLRRIRSEKNTTPVILLTARNTIQDKIAGIDSGADDYLTKPFVMEELFARIRMVLRRASGGGADYLLRVGTLCLNPQNYELSVDGSNRSIKLGLKEFQLMEYLMHNPSQVLSREQITQKIWGYETDTEYNNVDVYISFLRKKMKYLKTNVTIRAVRGVGYSLEEEI